MNPDDYNTPDRIILTPDRVDDLGHAIIALTRELWVVKDRVRVLEAVLDEAGIDAHAKTNTHQPDEGLQAELDASGQALVDSVMGALGVDRKNED